MIEQRLREYQAVSEMLQAAMADTEVENEEKEKMARKADENMVRLRADLQRARAYEAKHGRMPTDAELAGEPADEEATFEAPEADATILKTQLAESESKVAVLQAEIEHMQTKMSEFGMAAQEESEKVQTAAEAIRAEHAAKIDELVSGHSEELSGLHEKLEAAENMHKEHLEQSSRDLEAAKKLATEQGDSKTAELLEEQKRAHTSALEKLEQDLDAERKASTTAAAHVAKLNEEIKNHQLRLEEATKKTEQDTKTMLESHQNQIQIRDNEIRGNGQVIKNLEAELQALGASKAQEIEDMKQTAAEHATTLEAKIATIEAQLQEATDAKTQTSSEHSNALAAKTEEIENLQSVIDSLQNEISKLRESNSNELDARTVQLGQEHEKIVSKLKEHHESSVKSLIDEHHEALSKAGADSETLSAEHDKKVGDLIEEHQKALEGFSEKIEDLSAAKKSLEEKIEFMQVAHADELAKERKKVADSELALEAAEKSISSLQEKIQALEKQIEEDGELMQSTISSLEDAQRQNESLQKGLDSFEQEARGKDERHAKTLQKLQAETAESGKNLEGKMRELASMEQSHQAALKDMEDSHLVELEKMGSELTSKHDRAIKELQAKHEELAAANEALSNSHTKEIELLKSKHSDAINSHTKELDSTRAAHSEELTTLTKQYEEADAKIKSLEDQARENSATEAGHAKELESLLKQHEEELTSLRQELEDAGTEKSSSIAKAHAAQIAELQGEIHTHKEALVKAEQDLHKSTSNQAVDSAKVDEYKAEIESLQQELADSKKTAQSVTEDLKARLHSKLKAETDLQEASKQIADLNAKLAKDQERITELTGAAAEASKVMMDGGKEADQLRAENQELAKKHDTAISQLQQDLKSLTEGKANAEKGETAAKEQLKEALDSLKTAGIAEKDLKDVQGQLQKAVQDSEMHKANHEKALQEIETLKADTTRKEVAEKLDEVQQNLMSSNATNEALVQQLQEAEASVEKSTTRIRELEAQLKVTAAELTEAQTKRASGMDFLSSPEGKASPARGLAASQWANADEGEAPDSQNTVGDLNEGEEIGSSIEGAVRDLNFVLH
jgi:chromosome segregation ATPase